MDRLWNRLIKMNDNRNTEKVLFWIMNYAMLIVHVRLNTFIYDTQNCSAFEQTYNVTLDKSKEIENWQNRLLQKPKLITFKRNC